MKGLVFWLGFILIGAHAMSETHGVLYDIWPEIDIKKVDLFWSSSYKYAISIHWYIKMLFDDLFVVVCFYVMAKIAAQYSFKLFAICSVYMVYHIVDVICFLYNYKQTTEIYYALVICSSVSTIVLITPNKMKIVR